MPPDAVLLNIIQAAPWTAWEWAQKHKPYIDEASYQFICAAVELRLLTPDADTWTPPPSPCS
jgi:predicted nucleic acid-binding protein